MEKHKIKFKKESFTEYQLHRIRQGLIAGVDVTVFADPKRADLLMANISSALELGVSKNELEAQGFLDLEANYMDIAIFNSDRKAARSKEIVNTFDSFFK